jgi:hypothetical protein
MKHCANCGTPFEPVGQQYDWTRDFCSIGCYWDTQNEERD